MSAPARAIVARLAAPLLALAALGACSKSSPPPVAPAPPPPPIVSAMSPAPRSVFVPYDTDIWVEFAQALDPSTVTTKNVYLKIDTVRQPITLSWDVPTRRIHVQPQSVLALLTTYTVELSENILADTGAPLTGGYFWQFTTTSVHRPASPFPADSSVQSQFTNVSWSGNQSTPGTLVYELYAAPDSAVVAGRAIPYLYRGSKTLVVPQVRWTEHGTTFWSVTVENQTVGERSNGPVWRFQTPAADAPIDSLVVPVNLWGYRRVGTSTGGCSSAEILSGPGYYGGIQWQLAALDPTLRLAGVRMDLSATPLYADSLPGGAGVWLTLANMTCNFTALSSFATDEVNGHLATGTLIGPRTLRFESDTLIAYIQAAVRLKTFFGYLFRAAQLIHYESPQGAEPAMAPVFKLYYYTGNGTLPAPASARPAAANRAPAAPAGARRFLPLDRGRVQSFNSRR
jgi:hypothetical protein